MLIKAPRCFASDACVLIITHAHTAAARMKVCWLNKVYVSEGVGGCCCCIQKTKCLSNLLILNIICCVLGVVAAAAVSDRCCCRCCCDWLNPMQGAGSAGLGVCGQIVDGMVEEGLTREEALKSFCCVLQPRYTSVATDRGEIHHHCILRA